MTWVYCEPKSRIRIRSALSLEELELFAFKSTTSPIRLKSSSGTAQSVPNPILVLSWILDRLRGLELSRLLRCVYPDLFGAREDLAP